MDLRGRWFGSGESLAVAEPSKPDPSSRPTGDAGDGPVAHRLLGQLLVADAAITRAALQGALATQARSHAPLGDLLVSATARH